MAKINGKKKTPEQIKKEKIDRFLRIAPVRVAKALKSILLISNCAGSGYIYTPEQAGKILTALGKALDTVSKAFSGVKDKTTDFKF